MARKTHNPLQFRIVPKSLPASVTLERYYRKLIDSIETGNSLPYRWDVRLLWRNPEVKKGYSRRWQNQEFMDAIESSRDSFNHIIHTWLQSKLEQVKQFHLEGRRWSQRKKKK